MKTNKQAAKAGQCPQAIAGWTLCVAAVQAAAQTTAPTTTPPKPEEAAPSQKVVVEGTREPPSVRAKEFNAGVLGPVPLAEMPFSGNVITRELIDKQQATFIGDVLKNDPSVTIGNVAVPFLLLRGYTVGVDGSLYDGLPGNGGVSDGRVGMQAIDQVQVFKGASAFLFGAGAAGSLGGIINYLPKRPTNGPVREVGVGFANRSLWSVDADLGDRLGDSKQFGYRVNLGYRDGEQAVERYGWEQKVASVAFDWRAAPGLLLNFNYDHIENQNPQLPPFYIVIPAGEVPAAPDTHRSAALSWDDYRVRSDNTYLRGDWAFAPNWSMTAQAMHNHKSRPGTNQARFGSINNAAGDISLFGGQELSTEITDSGQLLAHGGFDTASIKHHVTFGLTGSRMKSYGNFLPIINPDPLSFGLFPSNLYQPVDTPLPAPTSPMENLPTGKVDNRSALLSDTIEFTEQWSVLLGARRASITQDNLDGTDAQKTEKTLPTAALMYKPTPASLVYLNYAEGLEQGGSANPLGGAPFLPPRQTKQVELGTKWELGGLGVSAALFDMKRPLEFTNSSGQNVQVGQQRHRGLELMASGRVMPDLTVVSGLMWLDASVEDSGNSATDGKRAPGIPRITANVWAEYRIASLPGLAVNGGVFYSGSTFLDPANLQPVPSWTRLDLGASYDTRIANLPTRFLLTIENAADKNYWASSLGGVLTMADPLTVKLGARVSF